MTSSPSLHVLGLIVALLNALITQKVCCDPPQPFQVFWNAETERCHEEFGIAIEDRLRDFGIVVNPGGAGWAGPNTTIFPQTMLGYYPRIADDGTVVNGGVPQAANLSAHLSKAKADIEARIPWDDFTGLGVIDWEAWRPLWDRDWDAKTAYQNLSEALVSAEHPKWNMTKVTRVAKKIFQIAARKWMKKTLHLAKSVRPGGQWGYYLFPHCYSPAGDTCPKKQMDYNDQLSWLFNDCVALYPSAYFSDTLNTSQTRHLVYREVGEARRVRGDRRGQQIYLYSRYTYREGNHSLYYTNGDIYNSIGMAAMMGASGIVLWDDNLTAKNVTTCTTLINYIGSTLGPGVTTASEFSKICSEDMCSGHGRCVLPTASAARVYNLAQELRLRHSPRGASSGTGSSLNSDFLHRRRPKKMEGQDSVFQMARNEVVNTKFRADGGIGRFVRDNVADFGCDCYAGWTGYHCESSVNT